MKKHFISGWGNFPKSEALVKRFENASITTNTFIPQGNLRSYGDSALATHVVNLKNNDCFLDFDENTGVLHCQSGVMISDIISCFLPRGWFPLIFPGTKFITIGGAIASDVHGKNHHHHGAFSESLIEFTLLTGEGKYLRCSRDENPEWFRSTCGGMGLTGIIVDARIQLQRINSKNIQQKTIKTFSIEETFDVFEKYHHASYSVAWLDCMAKGKQLGRSIITIGEHANDGQLSPKTGLKLNIPFFFPSFSLNTFSLKIINTFLFRKVLKKESEQIISFEKFFFPLDGISNWNRGYGKQGFIQYQFVFPLEKSLEGMSEILERISKSGQGSFLTVLKRFGKQNENMLSFPMEGYTLAIDFKNTKKVHALLKELDELVLKYHGRFYLAKDSRLSSEVFEKGYSQIEDFRKFRKHHKLDQQFASLQSKRLRL